MEIGRQEIAAGRVLIDQFVEHDGALIANALLFN